MQHTKKCLAASAICAIENFRDADWSEDDFLYHMRTEILTQAEGYLADGIKTCECEDMVTLFGTTKVTRGRARAMGAIDPETGEVYTKAVYLCPPCGGYALPTSEQRCTKCGDTYSPI